MRKNLLALLISLALINKNAYANLARHDIDWNEYEDFALNIGRYEAGREGIIVYKKDGTQSGIIKVPMPSFYGVSDSGNGTLYADPQIIGTVAHVAKNVGNKLAQRFMRGDVELSKGFAAKSSWDKLLEYSEAYSPNEVKIPMEGLDHKLIRLNQVVFDFTPFEAVPDGEKDELDKVDSLVARVGNGAPKIATGPGQEVWYRGALTGGLNKLTQVGTNKATFQLTQDAKTAIDSGTKSGDSGSPVFIYSQKSKKWYLYATNAAGSGSSGYGKNSHLTKDLEGLRRILNGYNKEIDKTESNLSADKDSQNKNLIYKKDVKLKIDKDIDLGPARLIFKESSTIDGTGKLTTAGIEVDEGKTLTFKSKIGQNTIIRKVGKGDLKLEGNKNNNKGSIHLGDGTLEIANDSSIGKIKIGSGRATIKITENNQFKGNQIYFGVQGGTLDLNGHSLTFNDIFHVDKGTKIVNPPLFKTTTSNNGTDSGSNTTVNGTTNSSSGTSVTTSPSTTPNTPTDNKLSTFTFTPDGNRVFLGSFNGNLNVDYDANYQWELRGNSTIKDLNVKKGTVKLIGDNVLHTKYLSPSQTEYHKVTFTADNINVSNGAKLTLGRASKTKADIKIDGTLEVIANGKVDTSIPKAYEKEPDNYQRDTNKIEVEGTITLNNSSNNVLINLENNNTAEIKSNISAKNTISLQKKGNGELILSGKNDFTQGNFDIENGIVRVTHKESAKKLHYTVKNGSTLEVREIETDELKDLLDKFDPSFNGILSLNKSITTLDNTLSKFNQLYLGTKSEITLGKENEQLLKELSFLNLGGDGGTITVKGLETAGSSGDKKTLNIGNGTYRGKVIIDKLTDKSHLNLNVHTGVDLEVNQNSSNEKFLELGYGSTAKVSLLKNLKESSEGVVLIDNESKLPLLTDQNYSSLNKIYLGASKGATVNINKSTISGDTYRFSGEGNTNLKFELTNGKDLIVDAQGLTGGIVSLEGDNENYKGKITIQGHREQNLGSITLKASGWNPLGDDNEIVIKNGGTLDLSDSLFVNLIKLSNDSNQDGTIYSKNSATIILGNKDDIDIKNKLSGKLHIQYFNDANVSLANSENNFTGNIKLFGGTLKYDTDRATNQNNTIEISDGAKIDITKSINSDVTIKQANDKLSEASILFNRLDNNVRIKKLILDSDIVSKGNNNGQNFQRNKTVSYTELDLKGHSLTAEDLFLEIGNVTNSSNINKKGNLILKNSTLKVHGGDHTLLSTKNFDKIELNDSTLDLRDYSFKNSEKNNLQKIIINGNSTISTGTNSSDGGGAHTTFNNPLELGTGSTLNITQSNSRWWVNMQIDSDIKGNGDIIVSQAGTGNLKFTNNFKDFTGSLKLVKKNNNRTPELGYYLTSDNEEDRTLKFKILSDEYSNQRPSVTLKNISSKDLILKNVNDYSGTLVADQGNIILDGSDAVATKAALKEVNDHQIIFKVDEGKTASAGGFHYYRSGTNNDGLHKKGKGELIFTDSYTAEKSPKLYIDEGKVTIATSSEFKSTQDNSTNTYLTYNVAKDANLNFKVGGEYTVHNTISGDGNVSFNQAGDNTKYATDYSKLGHNGDLTINAKVDLNLDSNNQNPVEFKHNLKGDEKGYLTIKGDNKTLNINKSLDNYTGSLEISDKATLGLNLDNTTLNNGLYGSGTITNINHNNLNLNNIANFTGTLNAKEGDISINNQPAANNANRTIKLKSENDHYINITTTDDSAAKFNFIDGNLRKKGTGTLVVNDNVTVTNMNHFDLAEGNLQLDRGINAQNIALGANTKLILNARGNINSNITGTGDVELKATNTLANNKLNHTGDLIVNADTNLTISGSENLAYHLKGKNTVTFSGENSTVQLHGSHINDFSGTLAINNTAELYDVGNSLTNVEGSGTIVSKSGEFSFNNTQFTGEIVADNANIKVIDAGAKKYTAKNADITLPYHLAKDNHSSSFSAINGAFVKADEQQWVLNRENLDKLGKLKIQSGEVIISDLLPSEKDKENENNSNSMLTVPAEFIADNTPRPHPRSLHRKGRSLLSATIPAAITVSDDTILPANEKEVEIKQGAKLILDTNHQVDKIKNEGTVNLNTHTLSIDDYSSEHGKIIIALNDKTNQVLNIKKTDKNVDVELVATKDTLTYLASNGIKIANLPTQLNILNEEQLTKGNYDLTNVNGMIKLLLAPNLMSKILRLTEIHQLNQLHTNEPFIEGVTVKANYSNGKIKEKFLKDYRNTLFKSQANTSGITINLGKTYGRFTGKLTLKALNTDFQSEVNHKTQQDKLKTLAAETGIKVEYKPGYGATLSAGILQSSFKQGKYALLNGNLSLYANPRYQIGKGVLTLENELSVRYTPILSQALPADEMAKLTNPFAYAYRLGLNYQYQKFDFNLATKVTFDNTQLTYIRKEALVNSDLIKGLSYQLSAGVKYHFTQKLNLSLTSDTTFSKNSTQFGAKIGLTYNF
ncbi:hypothetical protein CEP45_06475 [Mergibacter septicus]|uniref:S6 family peptidase n=1 Tax=Mergibacter septicus TaxID=221402 RepID=UPI001C74BA18|nr:S6 family peptidase [Mergibacter septicus]QDJ13513.1 hypothetical protein CEP45_06475 [Mergibacter septicus]